MMARYLLRWSPFVRSASPIGAFCAFFLFLSLFFLAPCFLHAQKRPPSAGTSASSTQPEESSSHEKKSVDRKYNKLARTYGFDLKRKLQLSGPIGGSAISPDKLEDELDRFFEALEILPVEFVKRSKLSVVMICDDLTLRGQPANGVAAGNIMYLRTGFSPKTIYHEIFHIFDPKRVNKRWTRLNPREFVYTGSSFYSANLKRRERKQVENNLDTPEIQAAFVSSYAQSFEHEDRAETFAVMLQEGRDFQKRLEKSDALREKMEMIIDMTDAKSLLGPDFWGKHLEMNLKKKGAKYGDKNSDSPSAEPVSSKITPPIQAKPSRR